MVTNYPRQVTEADTRTAGDTMSRQVPDGTVSRMVARLNQTLCGLGGHDALMHIEGTRVTMRCASCGHESPGWDVAGRGPRRRFEGDARRHRMGTEPRLVLRKTA